MKIIVKGMGSEYFTPNEVTLNLTFTAKDTSYNEVLNKGIKNVEQFINETLLTNNFKKEDLKTGSFSVKEDVKYDETTREYIKDGFSFNQFAALKFDYNKELMAKLIEALSKSEAAPQCRIEFGLKDEKECRKKLLDKAYKDAKEKASIIATAANESLKYCQKVDFKPFDDDHVSPSVLGQDFMEVERRCFSAAEAIINTFTPEDILLKEELFCSWVTEND